MIYLWDEAKTKELFRIQLILFEAAAIVTTLYTFIIGPIYPHMEIIRALPVFFIFFFGLNLLFVNKSGIRLRYLIVMLFTQTAAVIFMALSGGLGIIQFVPFVVLFVTIFHLGNKASLVIGGYSIVLFLFDLLWQISQGHNVMDFLLYLPVFILVILIQHNIGKEISLQFEAKKELEQLNDLKNQFIHLSSHYLRTPLTVIKGNLAFMEKIPVSEQMSHYLAPFSQAVASLDHLVNEFLLISSLKRGLMAILEKPTEITKLVASIVDNMKEYAHTKQIELVFENTLIGTHVASLDSEKITFVIKALLDNAIAFNHPGGLVRILLFEQDDFLSIKVIDSGKGIEKEQLTYLFEIFNKGGIKNVIAFNHEGPGMSLYLSKQIIDAHRGKITVESVENEGASFTILLPNLSDALSKQVPIASA